MNTSGMDTMMIDRAWPVPDDSNITENCPADSLRKALGIPPPHSIYSLLLELDNLMKKTLENLEQ